tara:strand:+ start:10095 stop:10439 length:345 start_codon:yes stop_codon:yes gene_type:complete
MKKVIKNLKNFALEYPFIAIMALCYGHDLYRIGSKFYLGQVSIEVAAIEAFIYFVMTFICILFSYAFARLIFDPVIKGFKAVINKVKDKKEAAEIEQIIDTSGNIIRLQEYQNK